MTSKMPPDLSKPIHGQVITATFDGQMEQLDLKPGTYWLIRVDANYVANIGVTIRCHWPPKRPTWQRALITIAIVTLVLGIGAVLTWLLGLLPAIGQIIAAISLLLIMLTTMAINAWNAIS